MNKQILVIDMVLVIGSLFALAFIIGYARPLVIAPTNDYVTTNTSVLFSFEKADTILLDDNLEFNSPTVISVTDNIIVNLQPGIYYWKVVGALSSEVRQFTISSVIDLRLHDTGRGTYDVVNSGNIPLDVAVYDHGRYTGNMTLSVDDRVTAVDNKTYIGGQR